MQRLAGKAPLADKVSAPEHRDHRFLALLGHDRELDLALLDIENGIGGLALPVDRILELVFRA